MDLCGLPFSKPHRWNSIKRLLRLVPCDRCCLPRDAYANGCLWCDDGCSPSGCWFHERLHGANGCSPTVGCFRSCGFCCRCVHCCGWNDCWTFGLPFRFSYLELRRLRGTLAPFCRAFESPIAMACLRFFTGCFPDRIWCISVRTSCCALRPYLRPRELRLELDREVDRCERELLDLRDDLCLVAMHYVTHVVCIGLARSWCNRGMLTGVPNSETSAAGFCSPANKKETQKSCVSL